MGDIWFWGFVAAVAVIVVLSVALIARRAPRTNSPTYLADAAAAALEPPRQKRINHFRDDPSGYVFMIGYMLASAVGAAWCFLLDNSYGGWWCIVGVFVWFGMLRWIRHTSFRPRGFFVVYGYNVSD